MKCREILLQHCGHGGECYERDGGETWPNFHVFFLETTIILILLYPLFVHDTIYWYGIFYIAHNNMICHLIHLIHFNDEVLSKYFIIIIIESLT